MTTWPPVVLAILLVLLVPSAAHAGAGDDSTWFLNAGGSFAYAFHDDSDNGGVAGLEVSAGRIHFADDEDDNKDDDEGFNLNLDFDPIWIGGYVDIMRDGAVDQTRISIGPEIGRSVLGIDAGLLVQLGDDRRVGISVRPALTIGVVTVSVRYGRFFDDEPDKNLCELGLLVKYPFNL